MTELLERVHPEDRGGVKGTLDFHVREAGGRPRNHLPASDAGWQG